MNKSTIELAREAGIIDPRDAFSEEHVQAVLQDLKAFEALVRADERDEILRMSGSQWFKSQARYDEAIRARGNT